LLTKVPRGCAAGGAERHDRLTEEAAEKPGDVDLPGRLRSLGHAAESACRCVADRAEAADEPAAARERAGFHVDGVRAGRLVETRALGRIVDDAARSEDRPRARGQCAERSALPEHGAGLVDDTRRVDDGADRQLAGERAGDAERHELALGHASRRTEPHDCGTPEPPSDALLDGHGAGECQPVSVQAMLLALSRIDPAAS
jgi:hypothetical protein